MRNGLNSENEIKIFILYVMNGINHGVHYDDIANITYGSGYVGYFDFAEIFSKLIDSKDVEEIGGGEQDVKNIYRITERGKAIAENLVHLLPAAEKAKGAAAAARHSDLRKSGAAASCLLEEETDGYRFKCGIEKADDGNKQENREIFHISLFIKDKITAERICAKFRENPNAVYRGVYAVLTGDADFIF